MALASPPTTVGDARGLVEVVVREAPVVVAMSTLAAVRSSLAAGQGMVVPLSGGRKWTVLASGVPTMKGGR